MAEFGAEVIFNTADTEYISVSMLDATHVVTAYKDTGGAGYGCARVGSIAGDVITWGAEVVFNSAVTKFISVAAMDTTHFVVAYQDDGGSDYGCARVGVVTGTTINSYGSENVFNSAATHSISVTSLDSTHFVAAYRDAGNSSGGTAIVGVVGGTTISSYGAENVFNAPYTDEINVATLDATHFVVAYEDSLSSYNGTAIVGVVTAATITSYGSEVVFNSATTDSISVCVLDSTHFAVTYRDAGNSHYGTARVGVTSGTAISSYGTANVFNSADTLYTSVESLDATHFVVIYRDVGSSNYGISRIGLISGSTISSYAAENIYNSAYTIYPAVTALTAAKYVVCYQDDGGADYGGSRVGGTTAGSASISRSTMNVHPGVMFQVLTGGRGY